MKSMRLAALLLAARAASVAGQILPAAAAFGADLVAYYAFDEGSGFDLLGSLRRHPHRPDGQLLVVRINICSTDRYWFLLNMLPYLY